MLDCGYERGDAEHDDDRGDIAGLPRMNAVIPSGGCASCSSALRGKTQRGDVANEKAHGEHTVGYAAPARLLLLAAHADFGDLLVVGVSDDGGADALFIDFGENARSTPATPPARTWCCTAASWPSNRVRDVRGDGLQSSSWS
jgi:hypothetical protein